MKNYFYKRVKKATFLLFLSCATLPLYSCDSVEEEESMAASEKKLDTSLVKVSVGQYIYMIPMNFMTPYGDYPKELSSKDDLIQIRLYLPDFTGYAANDSPIGKYNPDEVDVMWNAYGVGIDAESMLERSLKFQLVSRNPIADKLDLTAYKDLADDDAITYMSEAVHGSKVMIQCYTGGVNDICKINYFHEKKRFGIFFSFNAKYLKDWKIIDKKINFLINNLRVENS